MGAHAVNHHFETMRAFYEHRLHLLFAVGFAAAWLYASPSYASDIAVAARVVGVTDGDTITALLSNEKKQRKVRLAQIDAPESKQPFGQRAKQALSGLTFGKDATLHISGIDRNGRIIAWVECDGVSVNRELVKLGLAWVYPQYAPKDSPLYGVEREAKLERRGLWVDPRPVPPWEWRARARGKDHPAKDGAVSLN